MLAVEPVRIVEAIGLVGVIGVICVVETDEQPSSNALQHSWRVECCLSCFYFHHKERSGLQFQFRPRLSPNSWQKMYCNSSAIMLRMMEAILAISPVIAYGILSAFATSPMIVWHCFELKKLNGIDSIEDICTTELWKGICAPLQWTFPIYVCRLLWQFQHFSCSSNVKTFLGVS